MPTNPYAHKRRQLTVGERKVETDSEGYIQDMSEWSEEFAITLAAQEGLELTDKHWDVIWYIREYYQTHGVQAQVRAMIKHFSNKWGPELGNNRSLHDMFPIGGPQKQGNRLAGIRKTKGEH